MKNNSRTSMGEPNVSEGKQKQSVGVACVAKTGGKYRILLISKRYSYAFNDFIHGKYTMNRDGLKRLFDGMYLEDKMCVLSGDFSRMYDRVWMAPSNRPSSYFALKKTFESRWSGDSMRYLERLVKSSHVARPIWEMPKGRKRRPESDVACAVREFHEETGMGLDSYHLFTGRRTYSHSDAGVVYINTYYIGFCPKPKMDLLSFHNQAQMDEVNDIRWMTIEEIRAHNTSPNLEAFCKSIINYTKNRLRMT